MGKSVSRKPPESERVWYVTECRAEDAEPESGRSSRQFWDPSWRRSDIADPGMKAVLSQGR